VRNYVLFYLCLILFCVVIDSLYDWIVCCVRDALLIL
jgi:hypothetical protein